MDTKVDIADLIKPKFMPGDEVFVAEYAYDGALTRVTSGTVKAVEHQIVFELDRQNKQTRIHKLSYYLSYGEHHGEKSLYKNLAEIPEKAQHE